MAMVETRMNVRVPGIISITHNYELRSNGGNELWVS